MNLFPYASCTRAITITTLLTLAAGCGASDDTAPAGTGGSSASAGASAGGTANAGGNANGGSSNVAGANGGGSGGSAGSAGGSAGLVMPLERNGRYVLEFGGIYFEVDPQVGARITGFGRGQQNMLTGPEVNSANYGSTLALSPQALAGWPPPAALDVDPYQVVIEGDSLVMTSGVATVKDGSVRVTKRFTPDFANTGVQIEFTLENTGTTAITWAPWQITRVKPGGLTFFPSGSKEGPKRELPVEQIGGVTWFNYSPPDTNIHGLKYMADGSGGWLAQANADTLFVKKFADITADQSYLSEAEVSIYANRTDVAASRYVEIEPQGAYSTIAPGGKLVWAVGWYLRAIPAGTQLAAGSADLVALAQSVAP